MRLSAFVLVVLARVTYGLPGFLVVSPYENKPIELVSLIDPVSGEGLLIWPLNENNTNCMLFNTTTQECLSQKLINDTHLLTSPNLNWVCRDLAVNRQRPNTQIIRLDFPQAKEEAVTLSRNFKDDSLCPHRQAEAERQAQAFRYYWQARGAAEAQTARFWPPVLTSVLVCYVFTTLLFTHMLRSRVSKHPERYQWWQTAGFAPQIWSYLTWQDHEAYVPPVGTEMQDTVHDTEPGTPHAKKGVIKSSVAEQKDAST